MSGEVSRENGKLGGRPVSQATIRAHEAKDFISEQVKNNLAPIVNKAVQQAIEGDDKARTWLSDRAWGKPLQSVTATDEDGNPTPFNLINYGNLGGPVQVHPESVPASDPSRASEVQDSGAASTGREV